jgi:hypothetical protein
LGKCQITYSKQVKLFKRIADVLPDAMDELIGEVLNTIVKPIAIQLCPKRTGRLRKSIRVIRVRKLLWKIIAGDIEVDGQWVGYAKFVHDGTHAMAGTPFLAVAMQEGQTHLIKGFRTLERRIKRRMAA